MARIPATEIERLKSEVEVARLIEALGVEIKKGGKDLLGRCPFHEDATASLVVTPGKNLWHYFGLVRTLIRGLSVCTLALPHCAVHACAKVEFETVTSIYHDRLPELAWKPVAAARSYLVELTARVPEGPVVETRNLRTDAHRIDPPRLDASRPTKITIAVTPECASQQGARGEWSMLVLPSVRCGPVQDLRRDAASASRTIRWRRSVGEAYEVRAFDALSGALRSSVRADAESEDLPLGEAVVVAIRRVCPDAIGPSSYLFVD